MSSARLEAFSDGVLAIAITLLVLDLRLPDEPDRSLGALLARQWPSYLAYVVSFVVIGIMWVNHHALFRRVAQVDRRLLFLNLGLLMLIAALPFPTSVAAEGLRRGGHDASIAMFAYSLTLLLTSVAFSAVWTHIVRAPGILRVPFPVAGQRAAIRRFGLGLVVYAALCGLAFVSPIATLIGHGVVAAYYAFEQLPEAGPDA
ncbi:MAG: TMEM175 family protein [Frankiaceae bacterium]